MTHPDQDNPDTDEPLDSDSLDESMLDGALDGAFAAAREPAEPDHGQSVLQQLSADLGVEPSISLREVNPAGDTPLLKPLGPGKAQAAGKYMVQGMLGKGGVGAVHKGYDTDLGRDVAMKFLHERYAKEPSILHRFVEEAQIGGQLQHPGIVPVYELGISDGRPFFTMKIVKGETLAKKLSGRASPAEDRRTYLTFFEDICQTMAYAHARGVVHRDLKPANIMIGAFGEVQVVDWGMGKVQRSGGVADEIHAAERHTQVSVIETLRSSGHGTKSVLGSMMGTPAYMPPEQARGDVETMDERSDVFALGAILCEILTGRPPYVGQQQDVITMAALCKLDDAHSRLAASGADPGLIELVTLCLMPAPAARPQSAGAVAKVVHDYLAAAEQRVHAAEVRAIAHKRTQAMGITATSVIALALIASLWFWRSASEAAIHERQARASAELSAEQERAARTRAEGMRLAARADLEREEDTALALNLAIAGYERAPHPYTRTVLFRTLSELREVHTLGKNEHYIQGIDVSPDGLHVAGWGMMKYATVWDIKRGIQTFHLDAHEGRVVDVAYSPDGELIATASRDSTVRIWNAHDGVMMRVFDGHEGGASSLKWAHKGSRLVTTSAEGTIRAWDVTTGAMVSSVNTGAPIQSIELAADDQRVAVLGTTEVRIFQLRTGKLTQSFQHPDSRWPRFCFMAEGKRLLWWTRGELASQRGGRLWDSFSGEEVARYEGSVCPSPDGKQLVAWDGLDTVVRDATTDRVLHRYNAVQGQYVAYSTTARLLVSVVRGSDMLLLDSRSGEPKGKLIGHHNLVFHKDVIVRDASSVISASNDMTIRVWRTRSMFEAGRVAKEPGSSVFKSASPSGSRALVTREVTRDVGELMADSDRPERKADLVELPGGNIVANLTPGVIGLSPHTPAWSPDGQLLAFVESGTDLLRLCRSADGTTAWSVPSVPYPQGEGRRSESHGLTFSHDGSKLLENYSTTVVLRDVATGAVLVEYPPFPESACNLRWHPDGARFYSSDLWDRTATEWDAATGAATRIFSGEHTGYVVDAVPNPAGTLLATTAADTTISLWDLATGQHVHRFLGLRLKGHSLEFDPSGQFLFACCNSASTKVFDVHQLAEHTQLPHRRLGRPAFLTEGRVQLIDHDGAVLAFPFMGPPANRAMLPRMLTASEFSRFDIGDKEAAQAHREELAASGVRLVAIAGLSLKAIARGDLKSARNLHERLRMLRPRGGMSDIVHAALLVHQGDKEGAFKALDAATEPGAYAWDLIRDPIFEPLHDDERWLAVPWK